VNIDIWIVIYNGGGGNSVVSFLGDFLLLGAPASFGSAIETVHIYAHFRNKGRPKKTLESMAKSFRKRLKTLPLVWFKRKKRVFEIAYFSKLASVEEVCEPKSKHPSLALFRDGCREIVSALSLIRERLKPTDDFDFEGFDSHLQRRLGQLPTSVAKVKTLLAKFEAMEQKRIQAARSTTLGQPIPKGGPRAVALSRDDYAAEYVGWTKDGRQFFLTTPFVPAWEDDPGREFLALYVFDRAGALLSASIDDFGPRAKLNEDARVARRDEMLASLGDFKYRKIKVVPFKVARFGVEFGFIPHAPEDEDEDWCVTVEPGDYMCFWPPWTSGDYDT
jgi:hypothetical protein